MRSLLAAFRMLTRLTLPGPPTKVEDLAGALSYFPLVGAFVGACTAGVYLGGTRLWPPQVAAILAIAFGLLLTGGFHEDGASDAADGLGASWNREKVLEIMKDSRIGAFGAMTLWCMLSLRWSLLVVLKQNALLALPLAMALGRWSIGFLLVRLPPLSQGLASQMDQRGRPGPFIISTLFTGGFAMAAWHWALPHVWTACFGSLLAAWLWMAYVRYRVGGYSGDLLGAGNQFVEAVALLILVLR